MDIFKKGYIVAVLLAVLTIVEYVFAAEVGNETGRFLGLTVSAGGKAALIAWYFMHIYRVWRAEAH